ncbi:MAG: type I secretion system permease/ATPase [Sedimenticolaceae bacterium]
MQSNHLPPLKRILSAYRGAFVAAAIFSVFISLLTLTIPLYLMNVFTHVFSSMSIETLGLLTLVATGALLLQSGLEMIRGRLLVRVSAQFDARLAKETLAATLASSAGTNNHSAQPLRDVNELRNLLQSGTIFQMVDIPLIPVFLGIIYLFHPTLAAICAGGALILFAIAVINESVTRKPLGTFNELAMKSQLAADDYVRNADVIRAMGMMPAISRTWQEKNSVKYQAMQQGSDWGNRFKASARFVRMALQMAVLGTGTYLFLQHEILPGAIIAASLLMARALAPVESAIGTWKSVISGRAAYARLNKLLGTVSAFDDKGTNLPVPVGHLKLEKATYATSGGQMLLKQISFDLPAGQMLGLIGPSGAGKSTLGRLIVGIHKPNMGTVRLDGASLEDWHPDALGRHIGYLPQDVQLFSGTVALNIARMDATASSASIIKAAQRVGVHEMILRLQNGYDTIIGEGGVQLSSGQKQLIGLARAYFGNPTLVVLDEPNSNLDGEGETHLRAALEENKRFGVTQVVISHRPNLLQAADSILLLRGGVAEAFGPQSELLGRAVPGKDKPGPSEGNPIPSSLPNFHSIV